MRHAPTRLHRHLLQHVALAGLLGALLMPRPAPGQIPNVRRRATDAATRAVGVDTQPKCAANQAAVFDTVVLALTSARLDQVMKGLRARQQVLSGQRGAPSWNAMVSQRDAAVNAASNLVETKGAEMEAWRERRERITQCRDDAFGEKRQAREQSNMQRAMSDPDFMRRSVELSQRLMEAQQRGDTAAVNRLAKEANDLMGAPTREDTLAVDRHCGRVPPPPASQVQLDSLRALEDSLNAQLRLREQQADSVAIGASGMTAAQLAMGQERAEMFLAKLAAEGPLCGFTEVEITALKARRAELDELL